MKNLRLKIPSRALKSSLKRARAGLTSNRLFVSPFITVLSLSLSVLSLSVLSLFVFCEIKEK